ncbi:hypothetical protein M8494_27710 [Serratia ureilytica]
MQVMTTAVRRLQTAGLRSSCWRPTPPVRCATARWRRAAWWPSPITSTSCRNRRWSAPTTLRAALLQPGERLRSRSAPRLAAVAESARVPAGGRGVRRLHRGRNFETPAEIRMMQTTWAATCGEHVDHCRKS